MESKENDNVTALRLLFEDEHPDVKMTDVLELITMFPTMFIHNV